MNDQLEGADTDHHDNEPEVKLDLTHCITTVKENWVSDILACNLQQPITANWVSDILACNLQQPIIENQVRDIIHAVYNNQSLI